MQTREDIFVLLSDALIELFELDAEQINLNANLHTDSRLN